MNSYPYLPMQPRSSVRSYARLKGRDGSSKSLSKKRYQLLFNNNLAFLINLASYLE